MRNDFCVFILSHGRPDNIPTIRMLDEFKYTGRFYIVIDDEDKQAETYRRLYKDRVLMFEKSKIAETFDEGDNFQDRRAVIYARNACFDLAKKVGVKYFMQLDDDYTGLYFRFDDRQRYGWSRAECLDDILIEFIKYFEKIPALSICFSQGGDHIGGGTGSFGDRITAKRKAMNTFLCSVDRPFQFFGRINEDVNTYTTLGRRGDLFLTIPSVQVNQKQTQANSGGMTELYLDAGTYVKSFYSVMYSPSCVKISEMGTSHKRLHHLVDWPSTAVQILHEKWKKPDQEAI